MCVPVYVGVQVCVHMRACVCVCVCVFGYSSIFSRSSRLDLYGHTGILGSGRFPIIAGPRCRPGVLRPCVAPRPYDDMHLGQNLARCPRTTLEVGWWLRGFRRASSTVIVRRARHRHVAPCVVCVLGLPQRKKQSCGCPLSPLEPCSQTAHSGGGTSKGWLPLQARPFLEPSPPPPTAGSTAGGDPDIGTEQETEMAFF